MSTNCQCGCTPCGCCEGIAVVVPEQHEQRGGLSVLHTRIGTHPTFLASLKARLSTHVLLNELWDEASRTKEEVRTRPLSALTVRDNDATIAILDAWASVADVLTFYSDRAVNEGYVRTAAEDRSLHELARLPGYEPRPGVAASTSLAFTIDPTAKGDVVVPAGTRAQTVPGQNEQQQTFETSEALTARALWNVMQVRQDEPLTSIAEVEERGLWLRGTATRLKAGNPLLIAENGGPPLPFRVVRIDERPELDRTRVDLEDWDLARPEAIALLRDMPDDGALADVARRISTRLDKARAQAVARDIDQILGGQVSPDSKKWLKNALNVVKGIASAPVPQPVPVPRVNIWDGLQKGPSKPLSNANLLPRSGADLGASSAGTLDLISSGNAALAQTLGPALSGYRPPSREPLLQVFALRVQAGPFGRNFPRPKTTVQTRAEGKTTTTTQDVGDWEITTGSERPDLLYLDASYDAVTEGSWLLIDMRAAPANDPVVRPAERLVVGSAVDVEPHLTRADYGQSAETMAVTLDRPWLEFEKSDRTSGGFQIVRRTAVYAGSEELQTANAPITDDVEVAKPDDALDLDRIYLGLEPGRLLVVRGERADLGPIFGVTASEIAMISEVVHGDAGALMNSDGAAGDRAFSRIWLEKPLSYSYKRASLEILGNVVRATHGKSIAETLGNGDGSKPNQSFTLKQPPVTHLPAPTPAGSTSSLNVFVNGVRWQRVDSFVDLAPDMRGYVEKRDDKEATTITFGDGVNGAAVPTGIANVEASYRQGIGRPGNAKAGQISLLGDRPLGVRDVTNPVHGSGGADPETGDLIRRNIALASASLGRLVAVRDYADFARGFAGIAKADARMLSDGGRRLVHLTVAGIDDAPIDLDSELMKSLTSALVHLGDPAVPLVVATRQFLPLFAQANVQIDANRRWEDVSVSIRSALLSSFGFDARDLVQGVAAGEIIGAIQSVAGVQWVELEKFGALPAFADESAPTPDDIAGAILKIGAKAVPNAIQAMPARRADGGLAAAQLIAFVAGADATIILNQAPRP